MSLNFAFLVLEEHPYGREMLRILLERDFVPSIIIQEVSDVGDVEREKFLTRIAGQPVPPRLNQLITGKKIPLYNVGNHNDDTCRELLEANQPDVLVLGGTRIIKPKIFEIAKRATVNSHPGLLPWLRGSASVGWALYKDMPQGATVHFIDPGIDTGDIIEARQLPVYRHDTYESLNYRVAILAGELMAEALTFLANGEAPRTPQDPSQGETFRVIPDDLLAEGKQRLAEGRYSHFADDEKGAL
jgi:methionyl-tRNA formyltransferase